MPKLRKHEITVLQMNAEGQMALTDRCTISARDTADAAARYAEMFQGQNPHSEQTPPEAQHVAEFRLLIAKRNERGEYAPAPAGNYCRTHFSKAVLSQPAGLAMLFEELPADTITPCDHKK